MAARRTVYPLALGLTALLIHACGDGTGPDDDRSVRFDPASVDLVNRRDTVVQLRNGTDDSYGPVFLTAGPVVDAGGTALAGASLVLDPVEIATLAPRNAAIVTVGVTLPDDAPDGLYRVTTDARLPGAEVIASLEITFSVDDAATNGRVAAVTITSGPPTVRQGDVTAYSARALDDRGDDVDGAAVRWDVMPSGAGYVDDAGRLVAYEPGELRLVAWAGRGRDTIDVTVTPRGLAGAFEVVGQGTISARFTSDLWVAGSTAYTGSWSVRTVDTVSRAGNTLYAWDVSNPAQPALTDSVQVDATVVNDVKIRDDFSLAVMTRERASDGVNGIVLLDTSDPLHPTIRTSFTESMENGVHNVWLDGDYVYAAVDGGGGSGGLRIIDVSDPTDPQVVASFYAGTSGLHDVYVRDGLAFLSHWNAGLVILDVGNGIAGGRPTDPIEVSRILTRGGQVHNAWYWPEAGYVFVGEEDFTTPGIVHVVDLQDPTRPSEVATFQVPGSPPHNFWLDEARGVLYIGWYSNGLRAVDVTGELLAELDRQGREIAGFQYAGSGAGCQGATATWTCTWAPQVHDGLVYLSDMNTGLWVVRPTF